MTKRVLIVGASGDVGIGGGTADFVIPELGHLSLRQDQPRGWPPRLRHLAEPQAFPTPFSDCSRATRSVVPSTETEG